MAIVDGLTTLANVKLSLNIASATTTYDSDLERYVEAATPVIENITGPLIARSQTVVRSGGEESIVLPFRFNAVTSVVESGTTITDYFADTLAGIIYAGTTVAQRDFVGGKNNITAVVTVGSATIPANVELAARELVRHWWQIGRQANRPGTAPVDTTNPAITFGVPTRRLEEILAANQRVAGFA